MKRVLVGGPLLGNRTDPFTVHENSSSGQRFAPIVTPIIRPSQQCFILLPRAECISVLAYKTGKRVAILKTTSETIHSVALINQVVFVGCSDGILSEFALEDLISLATTTTSHESINIGNYHIDGPCVAPRRVLRVTDEDTAITRLTFPVSSVATDQPLVAYALVEKKSSHRRTSLVRLTLPAKSEAEQIDLTKTDGVVVYMDKFKFVPKKKEAQEGKPSTKVPFQLLSGPASHDSNYVVIGNTASISVYVDRLSTIIFEKGHHNSVQFDSGDARQFITAVAINDKDLAMGLTGGAIRLLSSALVLSKQYLEQADVTNMGHDEEQQGKQRKKHKLNNGLQHPSEVAISRRLHWHAHPVVSLAFDQSMLYSGGDESVLVAWHLGQGSYKPSNVLPRVGLGGIVHIQACTKILIYCEDNTLQLFESHNQSLLWKHQGLAADSASASSDPILWTGGSKQQIACTGLPGAPGFMHWYDPIQEQVTESLAIAPFNRVSRAEPGDTPMPSPTVTHATWSDSGSVLITVDTAATENTSIGYYDSKSGVGTIVTVRFWKAVDNSNSPYNLEASMAYPHGTENRVSSACVSGDGMYACTVSNDEKAFRLWSSDTSLALDRQEKTSWKCNYRIAAPSGYSNSSVAKNGVAYSSDASILAIAYGSAVTLWDHHQMTLLTSLHHLISDSSPIDSVNFVSSDKLADMLLTASLKGVSLQSPYGSAGPRHVGWSYVLPEESEVLNICSVYFVAPNNSVAIAIYNSESNRSRVVFVDAITGNMIRQSDDDSLDDDNEVVGKIVSIASITKGDVASNWGIHIATSSVVTLNALTSSGEMIAFKPKESKIDKIVERNIVEDEPNAPTMPLLAAYRDQDQQKRARIAVDVTDLNNARQAKQVAIVENFGLDGLATELPRLRGAFVRAFVGRKLQR
jgi:hypothetical protein